MIFLFLDFYLLNLVLTYSSEVHLASLIPPEYCSSDLLCTSIAGFHHPGTWLGASHRLPLTFPSSPVRWESPHSILWLRTSLLREVNSCSSGIAEVRMSLELSNSRTPPLSAGAWTIVAMTVPLELASVVGIAHWALFTLPCVTV